ncbi:retrovirus-related pol polyprotein from transposon TNT 1-94 [Tanacetum coccineum]|uniref:Retrovirus-related pol polyprotein from transposon TNT 1-94 n=1 Tax=Tanacetum coccineum TaxID=301880 RepID=A0ABQ5A3D0_9ASTR
MVVGTKASDNACQVRKETKPVKIYILLPLWTADLPFSQDPKSSHDDRPKPSSDDGKKVDEDQERKKNLNPKRAIGCKWVFKNKKDERGIVIRNKERLVAQGYTQEEGIDYDEVFASVRIEAIRLFLAYASFKDLWCIPMDGKSTFIYGMIEEVVLGKWQRPYSSKGTKMSSIGELTFFLGLQVKQKKDGIFISQDKYIDEILKKFQFTKVKTARTPMETQKHLLKDEGYAEEVILFLKYSPKVSHLHAVKSD